MKKLLLLACFAFCTAKAQTNVYHPFPDSSGIWHEHISGYPDYQYAEAGRDTNMYGKSWHLIYNQAYQQNNLQGGFREENKKIYYINFNHYSAAQVDSTYILFDFSLQAGDTMKYRDMSASPWPYTFPYQVVNSIDSILINNSYRKRWHLYDTWIEGIGSIYGLLYPITPQTTCGCNHVDLYCFRNHDTTFYIMPPYTNCFPATMHIEGNQLISSTISPNPFSQQTTLSFDQELISASLTLYNSLGQKVREQKNLSGKEIILQREGLEPGVYLLELTGDAAKLRQKIIIEN